MSQITTGKGKISLAILLAIYSISLVTSLPGLAISPILGKLERIFPHATPLDLQLLESLPSFIIIPFIILAGRLSLLFDKRKLIIAGLVIFLSCSILYLFSNQLWMLTTISAIMGIGAGLIIPFSTGLIADHFSGKYRTHQLGISSGITNLSLVLATFLAGYLATINWHLPFLTYSISLIALLFLLFTKGISTKQEKTETSKTKKSRFYIFPKNLKWPWKIMLIYWTLTFLVLVIPFNLSLYIETFIRHSDDLTGTLIAIFFLSMTLPGFLINYIVRFFKRYTFVYATLILTIGLGLFLVSHTITIMTIATILTGFSYGIMQPLVYEKTAELASARNVTFSLALVMSMNYIAIILYPFIVKILNAIFRTNQNDFSFIINTMIACLFLILLIIRRNASTFEVNNEKE